MFGSVTGNLPRHRAHLCLQSAPAPPANLPTGTFQYIVDRLNAMLDREPDTAPTAWIGVSPRVRGRAGGVPLAVGVRSCFDERRNRLAREALSTPWGQGST